ncbi:MAG TPA: hypothetical protein VFT98_00795 [Myxococcota bacterium]|nr:hypothetical protein [Myxococcota bacterium]
MSVVLAVDLDRRPLHRVPCDLVAAPLFASGLPMRGPAASLDWRLCGIAARAALRDRSTAEPGRALLAPTRGRMRAAWALFGGAGDPAAFGEPGARAWAADVVSRAAELRIGALALALAPERISRLALDRSIAATLAGAASALAARPSALRLRLVVAPADMNRAEAALAAAPRSFPGGVAIRIERAPSEPAGDAALAPAQRDLAAAATLRSGATPA